VVHELSDKFKGRNGAPLLFLGHVDVIDEENEFLSNRWSVDTLSSLVELAVKLILGLIGTGLCREYHGEGLISFLKLIGE
jgi:hypothetical protein